ncbi:Predicted transcriptional regulator [Bryocella elongata]|uniref:Predicted transcriptional regulator n=1 Tax=Bryocella elongata TaxID=863522 RepID=A0A1H6BLZ6_9BACT|nr:BlaI/MecI/CopY family transcriptional regulator [Bryocella elongata]SEG61748.1 Predicted transcriptional regulator [Bryocella elongata]
MVPGDDKSGFTKLELELMQVIWRRGASTVAEVQEELEQELAYTTVQTMLNILERKKKLQRELRGRAFVYSAAVSEQRATGNALRDLIDRMFGGSSEELVMSLVKTRQINPKRLAKLMRKLEED